jgi:hypothetical protein
MTWVNNLPETNRRPASELRAEGKFRRIVYARGCVPGGGRSANRSACTGRSKSNGIL